MSVCESQYPRPLIVLASESTGLLCRNLLDQRNDLPTREVLRPTIARSDGVACTHPRAVLTLQSKKPHLGLISSKRDEYSKPRSWGRERLGHLLLDLLVSVPEQLFSVSADPISGVHPNRS